jgi:hypothetical protein
MSKPISLSHSARGKYDTCPRMYDLHYNEKIRPDGSTSALLFGSAIDKACESYALEKNEHKAKEIFREEWRKVQDEDITKIEYHVNDFDHELLIQSDNESIIKDTLYATVTDLVKAGTEKERIAYASWITMYRKGTMLVKKFIEWFDQNVEEVLGTQVAIELEDEHGNQVKGLADLVIKIHGYDNPVLVDLKTAARYYDRNSVKESEQLALYYLYLKNTKYPTMERAAFLVLNKMIKKNRVKTCKKCGTVTTGREQSCAAGGKGKTRCGGDFLVDITPEVVLQYIHDEIPQEFIDQTIEKFNIAASNIKAKNFEPCWTACDNYFGRKCPYYEFCRSGSMQGLIQKDK